MLHLFKWFSWSPCSGASRADRSEAHHCRTILSLKSSSRFMSCHSKTHTYVVSHTLGSSLIYQPSAHTTYAAECTLERMLQHTSHCNCQAHSSWHQHQPIPTWKGQCSHRALTFKNCGVTRRTVATRQICSSVADLKARAIADSKPLQEGVGTRHNQTIYLRRGRRAFFSC